MQKRYVEVEVPRRFIQIEITVMEPEGEQQAIDQYMADTLQAIEGGAASGGWNIVAISASVQL